MTDPGDNAADFEWHDAFEVEGQAVCASTGAPPADVRGLLAPIIAAPVARLQVQPLLEQSLERLAELRVWLAEHGAIAATGSTSATESGADTAVPQVAGDHASGANASGDNASGDNAGGESERYAAVVAQLAAALAPDELAVGDAIAAVDKWLDDHPDDARDNAALNNTGAARLRWAKALLLALKLDFEQAARTCADAASSTDPEQGLYWQLQMLQAELLSDWGREFVRVEPLQQAIALYEQVLLPLTPADVSAERRAKIYDALGTAQAVLGQRHRGTRPTELAVDAFRNALALRDRAAHGDAWAATQNRLGNALGFLGQRQRDAELLEESVAAFDAALEEQMARPASGAYASSYSNLAAVLQTLGQQKQDAKLLKRAVDSYKSVLAVWTREHRPIMWAATMNNLGSALRLLGTTRKGPRTLEQAVAAFNSALSVRTRDRLPHDWAMTQNNLGAALQALGERTEDEVTLGKAVAAYRESVKELSADEAPMSWAMGVANLGVARRKLADRSGDIDIARRATQDIKAAIDIFRGASHAQLTELGEEQLSLARKLVAEIEAATAAQVQAEQA